jgi:hypothetical protein
MKSNLSFVSFLRFPSFQGANVARETTVAGQATATTADAAMFVTMMNLPISPLPKMSMTLMNPPITPLKMSMIWSRRRSTALDLPQVTFVSRNIL